LAVKCSKPNPDGIITVQLAETAKRYASRDLLDVDAAIAELRETAAGRADLLGEVAGRALGSGPGVGGQVAADMWPRRDRPGPLGVNLSRPTSPLRRVAPVTSFV